MNPERLPGPSTLMRLVLMLLSGCMIFLSFPFTAEANSNIWLLAWFGLIPFFEALRGLRPKKAFLYGALAGFVTNFGGFWWISVVLRDFGYLPPTISWPLTTLNAAYQGLMFAIVALLLTHLHRRPSPHPTDRAGFNIWKASALFTIVEWAFPMIFPWYLANSQYRFLPAIQIADLGGVPMVTFLIVLFNATLYRLWLGHRLNRLGRPSPLPKLHLYGATLFVLLSFLYGVIQLSRIEAQVAAAQSIRIGMVEADVGIFEKQAAGLSPEKQRQIRHRNILLHQQLSQELAEQGAELIVWPESAYLPFDAPALKTDDAMALALDAAGQLLRWAPNPIPGGPDFTWQPHPLAGPFQQLATLDESHFALLTPDTLHWHQRGEHSQQPLATPIRAPELRHDDGLTLWALQGDQLVSLRPNAPLTPHPTPAPIRAFSMRSAISGLALGQDGALFAIDNGQVRPLQAPGDAHWTGVLTTPLGALLLGESGHLAHEDIQGWQTQHLPNAGHLTAAAYDAHHALLWLGDDRGQLWEKEGQSWISQHSPTPEAIAALTFDPLGGLFLTTDSGALFHRASPKADWRPAGEALHHLQPLGWQTDHAFPRDIRWVKQGAHPLPDLAAYDRDPNPEFRRLRGHERAAPQRGFQLPILFGGLTWEFPEDGQRRRLYNTAILLDGRGQVLDLYDKVYLLAFGEKMPFGETFPWLYDTFPQAGRFSSGTEIKTFAWRDLKLGMMICYEDIIIPFSRKLAQHDPHILFNITNDAWFGKTAEPWLHLALATFRTVETRRALVRSTNTGVSAFVSPTGELLATTRLDDPETLIADIPIMTGKTLYTRLGNTFIHLLLGALLIPPLYRRARKRHTQPAPGNTA